MNEEFSEDEKAGFYKAIYSRRDVRSHFTTEPINNKILTSGIFNDLSNVLEKELNVRISQDNILGSSISMQGISGQNVKILINEIPVIGRMNGNIDLSQINLSNIERIEIVEGPMSTIYGSDALGGTINIITKQVSANTKVINTYYESIGKYNCDLLLTNKKENSSSSYSFGRKYFNGWNKNQEFQLSAEHSLQMEEQVISLISQQLLV